jgi:hypothetical protein
MDLESMTRYTYRSFAQGMPAGEGQADIPALMRRVADSIEKARAVADIEVQDIVFATEVTDDGDYPHFTIYFTIPGDHSPEESQPLRERGKRNMATTDPTVRTARSYIFLGVSLAVSLLAALIVPLVGLVALVVLAVVAWIRREPALTRWLLTGLAVALVAVLAFGTPMKFGGQTFTDLQDKPLVPSRAK